MLKQGTENRQLDGLLRLLEPFLLITVPRVIRPCLAVAMDATKMEERHGHLGPQRS